MKNILKTAALITAIAPTATFAQNIPVDFPSTFIAGSATTAQVVTKLDTLTVGQTVAIPTGPSEQK